MCLIPLYDKQIQNKNTPQYVLDTTIRKQIQNKNTPQYVFDTTIRKQIQIS